MLRHLISKREYIIGFDEVMQRIIAQTIDLNYFSQLLERPLYPFILLLVPEAPSGFIREWNLVAVSPQKNYGYAFQWFALAMALLII